jgi:hypothetical protein
MPFKCACGCTAGVSSTVSDRGGGGKYAKQRLVGPPTQQEGQVQPELDLLPSLNR